MNGSSLLTTGADQLHRLWYSLGLGMWLSLYYVPFELWRTAKRRSGLGIFLADVIFCAGTGLILFFFSLAADNGMWHLGIPVAAAAGFLVGHYTVGRLALWGFRAVEKTLRTVFSRLIPPLAAAARNVTNFLKKITIFLKKGLRSLYSLVYNQKR